MISKHIFPTVLQVPAIKKIILAFNSPRRTYFKLLSADSPTFCSFEENLAPSSFDDIHKDPIAAATHKAVEVYERLEQDPNHMPDIVTNDNLQMLDLNEVYPILSAPRYAIKSVIDECSLMYSAGNPKHLVEAYADSGEGGFGGLSIREIEGDYNSVVGFPTASFFTLLDLLVEKPDFLDV
ncbi:uncharacterized protein BT62DRAFT_980102 [Guyanagaster necrorhizus]|uniref:Uncharacterized protein n=1 Tax=Guyanagaster necrorhizus TaxID=856835 RepID=A0A9P7VVZ6_9AGAR|nr:uncharacterized protein BT62DRAFT_980102 [Guyanagaster necrorhizus MCA 3950]KAG7447567.1 hypothetical protein BT62DRAFT_980102 [Guyanagaster necrorhizus MCA 3950]